MRERERYRLYGLTLASEIALPEVAAVATRAAADITIDRASRDFPEPTEWFHTWRGRDASGRTRRRPWLSFARTAQGYLLRFPDLADFEVSSQGDRIACRPEPRLARSTLTHLLLDQVLPLTLSHRGHLVLHASAVHVPGIGAIAFAGPTGCGKSTLAASLTMHGCQTITDDSLVIAGDRGSRAILPGYAGVRLWRTTARALGFSQGSAVAHYTSKRRLDAESVPFRRRPSPLKGLFVLGKRAPNGKPTHVLALDPRERLMSLAPYAYLMDVGNRDQLSRMFRELSCVVAEVPVRRLRLRDGRRQPAQIAAEVLGLVRETLRDS
jgi:energy-coupling factor transporter ATP-binding protein EcfA2